MKASLAALTFCPKSGKFSLQRVELIGLFLVDFGCPWEAVGAQSFRLNKKQTNDLISLYWIGLKYGRNEKVKHAYKKWDGHIN